MANPTATVTEYCGVLARSRLLPAADVAAVADRWRGESKATDAEVDSFRKYLVARRLLTEYQAAMVQRGHAEGFYVGGYVIQDRIGKGQMAGVYKAVHNTGQVVALKVLSASKARNPHLLGRFQREARLLTQLDHPNIVRAFQLASTAGENGGPGVHYIVMEHLEGETLDEVLGRRKKLTPAEAARLVTQALRGLQHLHEKRMVHRDLKPANLMLVPAGPAKQDSTAAATLKILDIGLGREMFDDESVSTQDLHLTAEGALVGTPDYLAPEQARDARGADVRADIYSLGCVLYACLAGRPPFVEKNVMTTMVKHATEPPPPIAQFAPGTPPGLQAVLAKMLEKDPANRYQTPADAALALRTYVPPDAAEPMTTTILPGYQEFLNSDDGTQPIPAAIKPDPKPPIRVNPDPPVPPAMPRPDSAGAKVRPGGIATPTAAPPKPRASVAGPPSGKIKMGTGLAAALAGANAGVATAAPPPLKPPSVPPRPSPLPPAGPAPAPVGEFDVELMSSPLTDPADVLQARMAETSIRPLYDLDRRDFIMLSLGAGGVLAAVGLGLLVARLQGSKIQGGDEESQPGQP
jgi:serine/threonine protein kinase